MSTSGAAYSSRHLVQGFMPLQLLLYSNAYLQAQHVKAWSGFKRLLAKRMTQLSLVHHWMLHVISNLPPIFVLHLLLSLPRILVKLYLIVKILCQSHTNHIGTSGKD